MRSAKKAWTSRERRNSVVAGACAAFFVGMVGVSFAAVPLYKLFCQVTGYGGTTQRVTQYADRVLDETVTVRFDSNTAGGIPWDFAPVEGKKVLRIGETVQAHFTATNTADRPTRGRATFNVSPPQAGAYFNKVECFCFTDTELQPGETLDMPVVFYIDPDIVDVAALKSFRTLTLSYTFFPMEGDKPIAATPAKEVARNAQLGG